MADPRQMASLSPMKWEIIRLLKEWGKGTAMQLSKALSISRVAVHQHLDWLKEQGLVQFEIQRQGRGRPAEVFMLTEKAQEQFFPRRYDLLAFTALDEVASELGDEFLLKIFRRYRERMTEQVKVKGSLKERVRVLVDLLTSEGYFVRCEESAEGFVLSFSNCPIARVAKRFQEACISEEEVFERILGVPVVQQCRQALGDICCRYFVVKSREKERV